MHARMHVRRPDFIALHGTRAACTVPLPKGPYTPSTSPRPHCCNAARHVAALQDGHVWRLPEASSFATLTERVARHGSRRGRAAQPQARTQARPAAQGHQECGHGLVGLLPRVLTERGSVVGGPLWLRSHERVIAERQSTKGQTARPTDSEPRDGGSLNDSTRTVALDDSNRPGTELGSGKEAGGDVGVATSAGMH